MSNLFISYTARDRSWAEWIAWQLEANGYATTLQVWDFVPGRDWVHEMQHATRDAERILLVLSPAYLSSVHGEAEWRAAYERDPTGERGVLLPVCVASCDPPGLLSTRIYIDLVELAESVARAALLAGAQPSVGSRGQRRTKPPATPAFPGLKSPPHPSAASSGAGRESESDTRARPPAPSRRHKVGDLFAADATIMVADTMGSQQRWHFVGPQFKRPSGAFG